MKDILSEDTLRRWLPPDVPLQLLPETDSTNLDAKRWAAEGAPHGALVLALRQTGGRGRLGRSFSSPLGGLYLSVVLRPGAGFAAPGLVTSAAAVAVCGAVQSLCGLSLGIKWVNDLFYQGKKCCGILAEAGTAPETGAVEYMVVGIGLNLSTPPAAFPPDVAQLATSLYPGGTAPVSRAQLTAEIHRRLLALCAALPSRDFLAEYRRRSLVLGRPVQVLSKTPYPALALAINNDANLVVQMEDGSQKTLSYGEISIKWQNGEGEAL